jgi:hypothetical protein
MNRAGASESDSIEIGEDKNRLKAAEKRKRERKGEMEGKKEREEGENKDVRTEENADSQILNS